MIKASDFDPPEFREWFYVSIFVVLSDCLCKKHLPTHPVLALTVHRLLTKVSATLDVPLHDMKKIHLSYIASDKYLSFSPPA